jgi:hypothetical protein
MSSFPAIENGHGWDAKDTYVEYGTKSVLAAILF